MQVAKSLATASAEIDQLKKKVAALEKELAAAKEQVQKLEVGTVDCLCLLSSLQVIIMF